MRVCTDPIVTLTNASRYLIQYRRRANLFDARAQKSFLNSKESRILGDTSKPSTATKQEQATSVVDAELAIGFAALRETYVSEVSMRPNDFVKARAKPSALFNELSTTWQFTALPPKQQQPRTRVDFSLQYSFANQLHATLARQAFRSLSTKMIEAFALRAQTLYSKRNSP